MEQRSPDFEVPEATKQSTVEEIEMLLPKADNDPPIFAGLKRVFLENAKDVKLPRKQPARKTSKTTKHK